VAQATGGSLTCAENGTPVSAGYHRVVQPGTDLDVSAMRFASLSLSRFTIKRFRFAMSATVDSRQPFAAREADGRPAGHVTFLSLLNPTLDCALSQLNATHNHIHLRSVLILSSQPTPTSTKLSLHSIFRNSDNVRIFRLPPSAL
jgi:hypothetical protein